MLLITGHEVADCKSRVYMSGALRKPAERRLRPMIIQINRQIRIKLSGSTLFTNKPQMTPRIFLQTVSMLTRYDGHADRHLCLSEIVIVFPVATLVYKRIRSSKKILMNIATN